MKSHFLQPDAVVTRNLKSSERNVDVFEPLGTPRYIADEGFTLIVPTAHDRVVVSSSTATYELDVTTANKTLLIDRSARAGALIDDRRLLLLTDDGAVVVERDADSRWIADLDTGHDWPGVSITAEAMSPVTLRTSGATLSREYGVGDTPVPADCRMIRAMMRDAYDDTMNTAMAQGVFVEPVMARYVIKDSYGNTLHRGPFVVVMPPEGCVFDTTLRHALTEGRTVERATMTVPTYRLRVTAPPMTSQKMAERAKKLVIEVSPSFCSLARDAADSGSNVTIVRNNTSGLDILAGTTDRTVALSANDSAAALAAVNTFMAGFDKYARPIADFDIPFERGVDAYVSSHSMAGIGVQRSEAMTMFNAASRIRRSAMPTDFLNAPHTFTAEHVVATPGAIAYGNITPLLYAGYSAADYAATFTDTAVRWRACTTVHYADGRSSTRVDDRYGYKPLTLGCLICHPHPEARLIDIVIEDDRAGTTPLRWRAVLNADTSGRYAVGLTEDLSQRTAQTSADGVDAKAVTRRCGERPNGSLVAVATAGNPRSIVASAQTGSAITALRRAASSTASWDYGRTRFVAFTQDSVSVVNTSPDKASISVGHMAASGVDSRDAVTCDARGINYFVDRNGYVCAVDGSRVAIKTKLPTGYDRLGYDASARLLVAGCSSGAGDLQHIDPTTGRVTTTSSTIAPFDSMMTCGNSLLTSTDSGLFDIAAGSRSNTDVTSVGMSCSLWPKASDICRRTAEIVWNIDATHFDGTVSVSRFTSSSREAMVCRYVIKGRVGTPLVIPVFSRPLAGIKLSLQANVSADATLMSPSLRFTSHGH